MEILDARTHRPLEGGPTFPLKFLVIRTLWDVTWLLLGAWTPPPLFGWRRFLLRSFGAKISSTALIFGSARIWYPANTEIGNHVYIGRHAIIYSMAKITLDDNTVISYGAHLCTGTHDIDSPYFQTVAKPIRIKARAWVAAKAFVGPGITVGEGAVLGARGVAFYDLEPWTVYAGNPAKPIKVRKIRFDKT
ncbi:MAG TPA: putative colanic acid biosynthesis acetyltransferase [Methylocella sp.]|nr:putative colanic acid biosynthesis acetyltransferase [Methylocella sp.]